MRLSITLDEIGVELFSDKLVIMERHLLIGSRCRLNTGDVLCSISLTGDEILGLAGDATGALIGADKSVVKSMG